MRKIFKQYRGRLAAVAVVLVVLAAAFWYGGSAPGMQGWQVQKTAIQGAQPSASGVQAPAPTDAPDTQLPDVSGFNTAPPVNGTQADTPQDAPAPPDAPDEAHVPANVRDTPAASNAQDTPALPDAGDGDVHPPPAASASVSTGGEPADAGYTCTLIVRCDTVLDHMDWLAQEKHPLIPADGVLFAEQTVTFYDGESAFNVLQRELKRAKLHMEFSLAPVTGSAYIKGVGNLYEFDVGELSGWTYTVNDLSPNYSCSSYTLQDGDRVAFLYTCDAGADVGGQSVEGG